MDKVTKFYDTLYHREDTYSPGQPLATRVDHININDDVPSEVEVGAAVQRLLPHKAHVHAHIHA